MKKKIYVPVIFFFNKRRKNKKEKLYHDVMTPDFEKCRSVTPYLSVK